MTTKKKTKNPPSIWASFGPEILGHYLVLRRYWDELSPFWLQFEEADKAEQGARQAVADFLNSMPQDRTEETQSNLERAQARLEAAEEALSTAQHDVNNLPEGTPAEICKGYEDRLKEAKKRLKEVSEQCDCAKAEHATAETELEEPRQHLATLRKAHKDAESAYQTALSYLPRPHAETMSKAISKLCTPLMGKLKDDIKEYIDFLYLDDRGGILNFIGRTPIIQQINWKLSHVIQDISGDYYTDKSTTPDITRYRKWILVIQTLADENPNLPKALLGVDLPFDKKDAA